MSPLGCESRAADTQCAQSTGKGGSCRKGSLFALHLPEDAGMDCFKPLEPPALGGDEDTQGCQRQLCPATATPRYPSPWDPSHWSPHQGPHAGGGHRVPGVHMERMDSPAHSPGELGLLYNFILSTCATNHVFHLWGKRNLRSKSPRADWAGEVARHILQNQGEGPAMSPQPCWPHSTPSNPWQSPNCFLGEPAKHFSPTNSRASDSTHHEDKKILQFRQIEKFLHLNTNKA